MRRRPAPTPAGDGLAGALHAAGPGGEHADKLMLFGQFVGSWRATWSPVGAGREPTSLHGEVHFGWILDGRAIQDIWIVPIRREWTQSEPSVGFYGTTIRFYDPSLDAWRSTWIDLPNGRVRRFIGRPVENEIVLLSDEEVPQLRWRFCDITHDSFRWRAEISRDSGFTWTVHQDMHLRRTGISDGATALMVSTSDSFRSAAEAWRSRRR